MSIHHFSKIDSTNYKAAEFQYGAIIVAERQTKGHGRFKREWASGKGGLWFSIVAKPERKLCEFTFVASLAVLDSIPVKAELKWPNDILAKGKKLCGILTEVISSGNKVEKVIVGIGLNVNNKTPEIGISLKELAGKEIDREKLLEKMIDNFWKLLKKDTKYLVKEYRKNCSTIGKRVRVKTTHEETEGKAIDIDDEGNLILETKKGRKVFNEGEATLL